MPLDRAPPPSLLGVGILTSLVVAFALWAWGPAWHGGIALAVVVGAVAVVTLGANHLLERTG